MADDFITVCSACLRVSCWLGDEMCEGARTAPTRQITEAEARQLNREHPRWWDRLREAEGQMPND